MGMLGIPNRMFPGKNITMWTKSIILSMSRKKARLAGTMFIIFVAGIISLSQSEFAVAGTEAMHINVDSDGYAIDRYDPVAYFTESRPVRGSTKFQADYEGAKYAFSSSANQTLFVNNPKKYVPQYGGFCAYGVVFGNKSRIDPELWEIVNGRLYFMVNPGTMSIWKRKKNSNITIGNKAWSKITHPTGS